jgi:hypothetical protein
MGKNNPTISFSDVPSVSYAISGFLREQAILIQGLAVSNGAKMNVIEFYPLGQNDGNEGNLGIHPISIKGGALQLNELHGNATNKSAVFSTSELSYKGRYVSLVLGDVEKTPGSQLTFSFIIHTNLGDYNLRFVNGPLNLQGWWHRVYYGSLRAQSSNLIDLSQIFGFDNKIEHELKAIVVVVQKDTSIRSTLFGLSLGVATQSNSTLLDGANQYYVDGSIERYPINYSDLVYTIHDASIFKKMSFMIRDVPSSLKVNSNGWNVINSQTFPSSEPDMKNTLILVAEKKTSLLNSFPSVFLKFDIIGSLASMNQKDVLLVVIAIISLCCFMLQSDLRRFIWHSRKY